MVHVFCHDIAADSGGRAQHNEDRHQFFSGEAEIHGQSAETERAISPALTRWPLRWGPTALEAFLPSNPAPRPIRARWGSQHGDIADGLRNDHGITDPAGAGQHAQGDTDNDRIRDDPF